MKYHLILYNYLPCILNYFLYSYLAVLLFPSVPLMNCFLVPYQYLSFSSQFIILHCYTVLIFIHVTLIPHIYHIYIKTVSLFTLLFFTMFPNITLYYLHCLPLYPCFVTLFLFSTCYTNSPLLLYIVTPFPILHCFFTMFPNIMLYYNTIHLCILALLHCSYFTCYTNSPLLFYIVTTFPIVILHSNNISHFTLLFYIAFLLLFVPKYNLVLLHCSPLYPCIVTIFPIKFMG